MDQETDKTLEALQTSELTYRRLFETAKDGILILDAASGKIVNVNPFLIELLGYSYDQFIHKAIWDIGFFKDIIANQDNFEELKAKKYIRYEDMPLKTADGRKIDVEFVSNVYKEDGHYVIQCNIRDMTERKRAANLIAAERERLAVTLRSIGDGVITTDRRGTIEIINSVAEELCGWTQKEAFGKPLTEVFNIIHENTRETHENPVDKVLATGKIIELANHTVIISKNGTERIIADSAAPIRNKSGEIIGVVLVFRDITEKQKLLDALQQSQKLESLGLLAGGIAHDFNNLMGGVFGYIDLATGATEDRKVTQYLSKAMSTIDRARSLTHQLLTFAKGGSPIQEVASLTPLIHETAQFALSGSNVTCTYAIPDNLWPCIIDRNQICQVIDNIVINAAQAMPGGGTIEISAINLVINDTAHPLLRSGCYVKLSVKDHGIGISKKILSHIFDPFFTTKAKGHGLGLATSYSIMNRHSGVIEVESVLEKGSTFHIYLPASNKPIASNGKSEATHKGTGKIIIMDDEEIIRDTVSDMLKSMGYTVLCTNDGQEALDSFVTENQPSSHRIAALILDLTIPGGVGGMDVVKEIRKFDSEIPVFVASGYADDPTMKNPAEYGFTASICKPFRKNELAEMLATHLNG